MATKRFLDAPTPQELPNNLTIEASEHNVILHWEKPHCKHIYGPLLYLAKLTSEKTNYHQETESGDSRFTFNGLAPFTDYTAEIIVARSHENFKNDLLTRRILYNFTTTPAGKRVKNTLSKESEKLKFLVAPAVRNLEAYSIDSRSVSLRYDMPYEPRGIPKFVQVSWYDALMNTKPRANVSEIKNCKLWPEKYCVDLGDLIAQRVVKIAVSLKNLDTHMFGKEASVEVFTTHNRSKGFCLY